MPHDPEVTVRAALELARRLHEQGASEEEISAAARRFAEACGGEEIAESEWDEDKHPRADDGRFGSGGGLGGSDKSSDGSGGDSKSDAAPSKRQRLHDMVGSPAAALEHELHTIGDGDQATEYADLCTSADISAADKSSEDVTSLASSLVGRGEAALRSEAADAIETLRHAGADDATVEAMGQHLDRAVARFHKGAARVKALGEKLSAAIQARDELPDADAYIESVAGPEPEEPDEPGEGASDEDIAAYEDRYDAWEKASEKYERAAERAAEKHADLTDKLEEKVADLTEEFDSEAAELPEAYDDAAEVFSAASRKVGDRLYKTLQDE